MRSIKLILVIVIINSCNSNGDFYSNQAKSYAEVPIVEWVNGYLAEQKEPNHTDNLIYNGFLEVIYEYKCIKNDSVKFFETLSFREWDFVDSISMLNGQGIKQIIVTAENPSGAYDNPPQSAVKYEYLTSEGEVIREETTGVIENFKNIVIHNPRGGFFIALFSFPWPTIKFPIGKEKEWTWNFSYDSSYYGDSRFFNWEGITEMKYDYKYIGEEIIDLKFGKIETSKFEATGTNGILVNKLIYYFNSEFGFIKQIFLTSDGSRIELYAIDYRNKCKSTRD